MNTLFEMPTPNPQHPAKYTDVLLSAFVKMLSGSNRILDPFGGTGKVFLLNRWYPLAEIHAIEIEPEWAAINPRTTLGNALALPWQDNYFDAVCTSPTYGNAMADGLRNPENWSNKEYKYFTYAQKLNRKLHQDNSGSLHWNKCYQEFHVKAWLEASRALRVGGVFVLNIKNHIKAGIEQPVTEWHIETLLSLGYELLEHVKLNVPSMRFGQNSEKRIEFESVIKFILKAKTPANNRLQWTGGDSPALPGFSTPEV